MSVGHSYSYFLQVLTGRIPFPGVYDMEVAYHILRGSEMRPSKPENALAIGFSDPLWTFTERCWDASELRPNAKEVVTRLGEAAAGWDGPVPRLEVGEVEITVPRPSLSNGDAGGRFLSFPNDTPRGPPELPATFERFQGATLRPNAIAVGGTT